MALPEMKADLLKVYLALRAFITETIKITIITNNLHKSVEKSTYPMFASIVSYGLVLEKQIITGNAGDDPFFRTLLDIVQSLLVEE